MTLALGLLAASSLYLAATVLLLLRALSRQEQRHTEHTARLEARIEALMERAVPGLMLSPLEDREPVLSLEERDWRASRRLLGITEDEE